MRVRFLKQPLPNHTGCCEERLHPRLTSTFLFFCSGNAAIFGYLPECTSFSFPNLAPIHNCYLYLVWGLQPSESCSWDVWCSCFKDQARRNPPPLREFVQWPQMLVGQQHASGKALLICAALHLLLLHLAMMFSETESPSRGWQLWELSPFLPDSIAPWLNKVENSW